MTPFFFARPTQRVGLLHYSQMDLIGFSLLAFPHAREILLEMLTIDSNRKLDAVQFFEHVCVPRQNLINLLRPMPSWRPFTKLFVFSSQWQYRLPNQISNSEIFRLDLLVVCTGNFSFVLFNFFQRPKPWSSTLSFIKAAYCSADRSFWNSTRLDPALISHGSTASWP